MIYLCTPCFLQCQVILHPSTQCGASSQPRGRLNRTPMTVCLELSSTVLCVCYRKPPKARLAPLKLPELQVHLVHVAPLPACVGRICAATWEFGPLVLTVLVGDSRCRVPVQKQWEERDSPQHVLAASHKEDGRGGRLIKVKGYGETMTKVSCNTGTSTV